MICAWTSFLYQNVSFMFLMTYEYSCLVERVTPIVLSFLVQVQGSLGMNVVSALFSAVGISVLIADFFLYYSCYPYEDCNRFEVRQYLLQFNCIHMKKQFIWTFTNFKWVGIIILVYSVPRWKFDAHLYGLLKKKKNKFSPLFLFLSKLG